MPCPRGVEIDVILQPSVQCSSGVHRSWRGDTTPKPLHAPYVMMEVAPETGSAFGPQLPALRSAAEAAARRDKTRMESNFIDRCSQTLCTPKMTSARTRQRSLKVSPATPWTIRPSAYFWCRGSAQLKKRGGVSAGDLSGRWMRRARRLSPSVRWVAGMSLSGVSAREAKACASTPWSLGRWARAGGGPCGGGGVILRIAGCDRLGHLYLLGGLVAHDTASGGAGFGGGW